MVTNGGKPPRCGDDAPSVMALENRGPCAHRGGGVGGAGGWVRRRVRHAASAVDGVRDAPDAAPLQLGRARKDFVLRSHDAAKGEVLWPCGATSCWPSGTRSRPEEFVPERSVGGARRGGGRVAVATTKHRPSQHCPGRNTMGLTTTLSNG